MLDEIDRFLNYEMIPEEESDFIARMEKDEVLREQVFLRQLVVEAERKKAEARILYQKKPDSCIQRSNRSNSRLAHGYLRKKLWQK